MAGRYLCACWAKTEPALKSIRLIPLDPANRGRLADVLLARSRLAIDALADAEFSF
jgi:hypothetical protein